MKLQFNEYKKSDRQSLLVIIDVFIIFISLISSWLIRSRFEFFLYDLRKFVFLFPWVLFSRMFIHFFFGLYSFSPETLNNRDILRIFKYNSLPTIVLVLLRLIRPHNPLLVMPISMIAMEYIFSIVGFVVIRLIFNSKAVNNKRTYGYNRKIILWAENSDLKEKIDIERLFNESNVQIIGIINSNPLFWNSEYNNIRVLGNESEVYNISASDSNISGIAILRGSILTKKQKKEISSIIETLHMNIGEIYENCYENKTIDWLWTL